MTASAHLEKGCAPHPPLTPDGRYIVVRGRLWRASNPSLSTQRRAELVAGLMDARRDVARALRAGNVRSEAEARAAVDAAKTALGERGPPWWTDGEPDLNRRMVMKTPYAGWFETVSSHAMDRR